MAKWWAVGFFFGNFGLILRWPKNLWSPTIVSLGSGGMYWKKPKKLLLISNLSNAQNPKMTTFHYTGWFIDVHRNP